jgi:hypothetical protein
MLLNAAECDFLSHFPTSYAKELGLVAPWLIKLRADDFPVAMMVTQIKGQTEDSCSWQAIYKGFAKHTDRLVAPK